MNYQDTYLAINRGRGPYDALKFIAASMNYHAATTTEKNKLLAELAENKSLSSQPGRNQYQLYDE